MSDTDKHRFVGQRGSKHFQEQTLPYKQTTKRPRIYPTAHQSREPRKFRKGPWIIGGVAVYSFTLYGFFLYNSLSHVIKDPPNLDVPRDVADRYDRTAKGFDSEVNLSEKLMGLGWLRQSLTGRAIGNVLEASVGTGRNIQYFNLKKVKSLTVVDQSSEMLNIAKEKFHDIHPNYRSCVFIKQSALDPIPCPSPNGFDTVIQTMGVCSTPDPAMLLTNLGKLTRHEGGQILLLEHGRSHYAWLNRILDTTAPAHADKHGCWWNKDIGQIVKDSGLEVVKIKRYHLGTTWWIELRPPSNAVGSIG